MRYAVCGTSFLVRDMRYKVGTGMQYEVCGTRYAVRGM